jgi:hypothetical protein
MQLILQYLNFAHCVENDRTIYRNDNDTYIIKSQSMKVKCCSGFKDVTAGFRARTMTATAVTAVTAATAAMARRRIY